MGQGCMQPEIGGTSKSTPHLASHTMLQIIIFQLSALLWATSSMSKSVGIQFTGFILAVVFVIWGFAQGASIPSFPNY